MPDIVYIDENGIDVSLCKDRGSGKRNDKLVSKKSGKYDQRMNIIAGYVNYKPIVLIVFNSACNTQLIES